VTKLQSCQAFSVALKLVPICLCLSTLAQVSPTFTNIAEQWQYPNSP
jgi:hypothetical protein